MSDRWVFDALGSGKYTFLDLGSGTGGSLDHCVRRFGLGPGLGVEYDGALVEDARREGFDVVRADVTKIEVPEGSVKFLSAMDFLEHLPDEQTALSVVDRCRHAARDFVFIRHPSFEDMDYLASLGLKLCWTDWAGHPNMMRLSDFLRAFERFGWTDYIIYPRLPILDSSSDQVVALGAPPNVTAYDEALHGPKPFEVFDRPVYTQFDIFVRLNPDMDEEEWEEVITSDLGTDVAAWQSIVPPRAAPKAETSTPAGLYTPADSRWYLQTSEPGARWASMRYGAGSRGLVPLAGDFDGDGRDGVGIYDPSTGDFFLKNVPGEGDADLMFRFGPGGGVPVVGDWTGSGVDTVGLYMPETGHWFVRNTNTEGDADLHFSFGPGDSKLLPVVGDWDGDGVDSAGLYDPSTGIWYLRDSLTDGDADTFFAFGPAHALPVVGDWDGDGVDSVGVYLPATGEWCLRNSNDNGPSDVVFVRHVADAIPVVGRWELP
jgi:hypothetical protein